MQVVMRYGRTGLPLNFPDDWEVDIIATKPMPVLNDPAASLDDALSAGALEEEAQGCRSACILICDITRPVPNSLILPILVSRLIDAGIPAEWITVLVATGLHRPNEGDELSELVGDDPILSNVMIANHFARDDDAHVYLGETSRGTPVRLDRRFLDADLRIVVGLVEPHFMAGYSGGRKLIAPGIAHHSTIVSLHRAGLLAHPRAANCIMKGNPVHEELLQIARMAGDCNAKPLNTVGAILPRSPAQAVEAASQSGGRPLKDRPYGVRRPGSLGIFAVNVVIDADRRPAYIDFGGIEESHYAAVSFIRPYVESRVGRRYRTVVTSAGGYPLDKTYYQTVKGMVGAMDILEPGGDLFIVSECSEGMGSAEYVDAQRRLITLGPQGFVLEIANKQSASIDEWQTQMQLKAMLAGRIHVHAPCLSAADAELTGVGMIDDIVRAIRESGDRRIAVIPEGPYVVPMHGGSE